MNSGRFSVRPLHAQVRDELTKRLSDGVWKPGAVLPNEDDLARELGVSPGTVRKALDFMESARLLTRRQGRGTFVNDQATGELSMRFNNVRNAQGERFAGRVGKTEVTEGEATEMERKRLQLEHGAPVYRFRRARSSEDNVYMVDDASVPAVLFPALAAKESIPICITDLCQQYGILPGKAEERISLGTAAPDVAALLAVAPNSPMMILDRVVYALDGRPVQWRLANCNFGDEQYVATLE